MNNEIYIDGIYQIIDIDIHDQDDYYEKIYIRRKNSLDKYYFNISDKYYHIGDLIKIKGNVELPTKEKTPRGFNNQEYLRHQGIIGKIRIIDISIIDHKFHLNYLHEALSRYINNHYDYISKELIAALTIGNKYNMSIELKDNINKLGISHLFVISGLHIELLATLILFFLKKLKNKIKYLITLIILIFYYTLAGFGISILRVIIAFIINRILNKQTKVLTPLDKISLNALIVIIINPFNLFSYSFLLSYSIVMGITLLSNLDSFKYKFNSFVLTYLKDMLIISINSMLISLPLIMRMGEKINLLLIIYNLFFIPFVSYILLPLSFITLIIPPLSYIYHYIGIFFFKITSFLANITFLEINFPKISIIILILYYLLYAFIIIIKNKRKKSVFSIIYFIFILLIYLSPNLNIHNNVYFLSLPIGDSILIREKYNQTNILIDCGEENSELISFLNNNGIRRIDAVIISHGDNDHIGGLDKVIKEKKVKSIFLSYYDKTSQIITKKILDKYQKKIPVYYLKDKDQFMISSFTFNVLSPNHDYGSINDNSLVLYAKIFGYNYLFTGDIEKKAEEDLIKKYPNIDVDILKVSHHASNTSSSMDFLKTYKPRISIAMNGYNNHFGFPNQKTIHNFQSLMIIKSTYT